MNFQFMKQIDYWIGIPLCFVLTMVNSLVCSLSPRKTSRKKPRKILLIKPSEMGAIVLSHPLITRIKSEYPGAKIYFLTFKSNEDLFDVLDGVSSRHLWTIRDRSLFQFIIDVFRIIGRMRKEKFDVVIDLEFFSRFTAILSYLSGAKRRIGFHRYKIEGVYRGNLFTHRVAYNSYLHISEMYYSMGEYIRLDEKSSPESDQHIPKDAIKLPVYEPSAKQLETMQNRLSKLGVDFTKKLYLIGPGEGRIPLREWPVENFVELVQKILKDPDHQVLLIGVMDRGRKAEQIREAISDPDRCLDLIGKTGMRDIMALFSQARALVTNDSGTAHLAALTPVAQYVLFGPETPRIFASLSPNSHVFYVQLACSPCLSVYNHRNSACRDNRCLKLVSPQQVYDSIFL